MGFDYDSASYKQFIDAQKSRREFARSVFETHNISVLRKLLINDNEFLNSLTEAMELEYDELSQVAEALANGARVDTLSERFGHLIDKFDDDQWERFIRDWGPSKRSVFRYQADRAVLRAQAYFSTVLKHVTDNS